MTELQGEPLAGIVVLELGSFITAPYAGLLLAGMGADVVKIEKPEGDPFRAFRGGHYSPNFVGFNHGKRSICLDIATPAGRADFMTMVARADVVLENFRPGVMEKLGLSSATLMQANERLVYCAISGFPPGSSREGHPAFDLIGQALSGMLHSFLDPQDPQVRGPTIADQLAGMNACMGIMGALMARQQTGRGRRVDVNMVESAIAFMPDFHASVSREGVLMGSKTRAAYSHSLAFRCSDGRLIALQLSSLEKFWQGLLRAVQAPELAQDDRFSSRMKRIEHFDALREDLAARFERAPLPHWLAALAAADVPHAPVLTAAEVREDDDMAKAGTFQNVNHPTMGTVSCIARPVLYDGQRPASCLPPPTLNEHEAELRRQFGLG